jgi:hypothetical protein
MKTRSHDPSSDRRTARRGLGRAEDGFSCAQCHAFVSAAPMLSGVPNRNHCPYCLWSRHVDLNEAGDRLSSCQSRMEPVALTVKATRKKYGPGHGELMLVHVCTGCGKLSINRIAADDAPEVLLAVFEGSFRPDAGLRARLEMDGIRLLGEADRELVRTQLFGRSSATG